MAQDVKALKFETWKHGLLDVSKRNKMINYRKTKRATLQLVSPDFHAIFDRLVLREDAIPFKIRVDCSQDTQLSQLFYLMDKMGSPVEITKGEIDTELSVDESNRTLKQLRSKSKLSWEEQGINILYLSFGFLEWRQKPSETAMLAPLVLVPVSLTVESYGSPYVLRKLDEDIVVNPTLAYVLSSDFGIDLPDFEPGKDDLDDYIKQVQGLVASLGWQVHREMNLGLLSFLKIVMYKDLEKHKQRIFANPIINAFCGDGSLLPQWNADLVNYQHDKENALDTFQVVNADSSQQDAILLSKKGYSFVLQGPPGTGKSQTITNIIAEGLADGKRILFVSEKMAALSVVYRRLQEVHLSEYCLSLHNYKADKKKVITELAEALDTPRSVLNPGVLDFVTDYESQKNELDAYFLAMRKVRQPLSRSLYDVIAELSQLDAVPVYHIPDSVLGITGADYREKLAGLRRFQEFQNNYRGNIAENPWRGSNITLVTYDLRKSMEQTIDELGPAMMGITAVLNFLQDDYGFGSQWTWREYNSFIHSISFAYALIQVTQQAENYYVHRLEGNLAASLPAPGTADRGADTHPRPIGNLFETLPQTPIISDLLVRYDDAKRTLSRCGYRIADLESSEIRQNILANLREKETLARRECSFIDGANHCFAASYAYNRDDLQQLMSFLDTVSACEEFDVSWLKNAYYERAIDTLHQIRLQQDAVFTIERAVRETIEAGFIGSGTAGKSAAKEISDVNYEQTKENIPEQNYGEVNSSNQDWTDIAELRNAYNPQKEHIVSLKQKWNDTCIEAECNNLHFETMTEVVAKKQELCEAIKGLEVVRSFVNSVDQQIHLQHCSVSDGLARIKMIVRILMIPYNYQLSWVTAGRFSSIGTLVKEQEALAGQIKEQSARLLENWEEEFLSFDCEAIYSRFKTDYTSFFKRIGNQYKEDKRILKTLWKTSSGKQDDDVCLSGMEHLRSYQKMKKRFDDKSSELNVLLSGYYHGLDTNWSELHTLLGACTVINDYYEKYGFSPELRELLGRDYAARRSTRLNGIWVETLDKGDLLNTYENDLYPFRENEAGTLSGIQKQISQIETMEQTWADIEDMVYSVRPEKSLKSSVDENSDSIDQMKANQSHTDTARNHTDESQSRIHRVGLNRDIKLSLINTIFTSISSVLDVLKQYEGVLSRASSVFPVHYRGDKTDWNYVQECLNQAKGMILYAGSHELTPAQTWYIGMKKSERDALVVSGMTLKDWMAAEQRENLETVWAQTGCASVFTLNADTGADIIAQMCSDSIRAIEATNEIIAEVSSYFKADWMTPAKIEERVSTLRNYLDVMDFLNSQHAQANRQFEHMGICDVWSHTEDLFMLFDEYIEGFSEQVKNAASSFSGDRFSCENALRTAYQESSVELREANALRRFASWFEADILSSMSLIELSERIPLCSNFEELNSWQLYHSIRTDCEKKDLGAYLSYVESESVASEQILPIYRKSFLTRWALEWLGSDELQPFTQFQSFTHENLIRQFRANDQRMLKVNQARLNEKLSAEKPSGHTLSLNGKDEISILRREAEKKRKIMPLRRLFKEIPMLLQKLKPCFMMSPLSVSYFLDSDIYEFDMVIFDEASQILPEDAIGAIYRGKQVIIAGDTRQMPPTNFFTATARNEESYDVESENEEDDYYDVVSESILDEANTCLPGCTLLWHYRSKDESLIAFSNREIYGNRLTTFPNCQNQEDKGLEYIYVPGGYYEGGGKNCNVEEAKRCVDLVAEHVQQHPERSLGIIAFSEKQQGVIENAVQEWRLKNPKYDDFFDEEKEEPFFVKNLESVQGDERDTIIFSICYAKNKDGRMYMRFGPLGKAGGERRLNVAITRAKYNVKLVGSILPNDIALKESSAEGVRLLHDYIYYAMQNDYGLPEGEDIKDAPDSFPEMISNFITESGYNIRRNVGASQYKVDIAVLHPSGEDTYIAGIECDGDNYTAARTARDRDFLRKDIMESMGWHIYHVWSLAWYKNPQSEKQRLLDFLENAVSLASDVPVHPKHLDNTNIPQPSHVAKMDDADIMLLTTQKETVSEVHHLEFERYAACNPLKAVIPYHADSDTKLASQILYVLENEQPIHIELLYKRLAVVFGKQKVTEPVKRSINTCMQRKLTGKIEMRDDFVYLKGTDVIKARTQDGDERPIEYICPEEIQDAMKAVVALAYGIDRDSLLLETAKVFGFTRRGAKITEILTENFDRLLSKNVLIMAEGKVHLQKEAVSDE